MCVVQTAIREDEYKSRFFFTLLTKLRRILEIGQEGIWKGSRCEISLKHYSGNVSQIRLQKHTENETESVYFETSA
jgi:hypothetical protein